MQEELSKEKIREIIKDINQEDTHEKILFLANMHDTKGSVSVRVTKRAFELAKAFCKDNEMSVNAYVTSALAMRLFDDIKNAKQLTSEQKEKDQDYHE